MSDRSGRNAVPARVCCACATLLLWLTNPVNAAGADARQIIERVYSQDTSRDAVMRASFEVFDRAGHGLKKRFSYLRTGAVGDTKTLLEFSDPEEIRGVKLLSINRPGSAAQYIYTPATQRARSVAPQQRDASFLGTDFTFEDLQQQDPAGFSYQLLDDTEQIDGHRTFKIKAVPLSPEYSQYRFRYYWVAQDAPVILRMEMFDAQGDKVRELHATELKRVAGFWGARRTEIDSVRAGTRTVLSVEQARFNVGLDPNQLTPEALEQGRPVQVPTGGSN